MVEKNNKRTYIVAYYLSQVDKLKNASCGIVFSLKSPCLEPRQIRFQIRSKALLIFHSYNAYKWNGAREKWFLPELSFRISSLGL